MLISFPNTHTTDIATGTITDTIHPPSKYSQQLAKMQIVGIFTILACAITTATATGRATLGAPCDAPGTYTCTDGPAQQIAVCNINWQLAADCGTRYCVWPAGYPVPFCA
ncbi:hypothetical protein GGR51DRAFT_507738 [Nemania sp. FL0031]|nr:hypothetical protein GGR51DRAFT_507738 [Nemania sp. FL0031]